jgi:ribosomal-protein-alanine N-acetyltransferase
MTLGPRLQTERLELRPLDPRAASVLADNPDVAIEVIGASPATDWPNADLMRILPRQAAATPDNAPWGVWVIIDRATETLVGDMGFKGPPGAEATLEIGYGIVPSARRRGYASEAGRALVEWGLDQPGVDAVLACCDEDNEPSIRTLERIGFAPTGRADGQLWWRFERRAPADRRSAAPTSA